MKLKISQLVFTVILCLASFAGATNSQPRNFTIDEVVKEVLKKNPQIHEAKNRVKSAKESLVSAKTDLLPKAALSYSYTGLDDDPVMKQAGSSIPAAHKNQHHMDISLTQPLFTGFALTSQVKQAEFDLKIGEITEEQRLIELTMDAKIASFNYLLACKMTKVAKDEVAALKTHRDEASQLYTNALIPKNDLLKSEVALASAIQSLESTKATKSIAMALVNMLMDADPARQVAIVDIDDKIDKTVIDYSLLANEAKKNRPELISLRNSLKKAEIGKTLAQSGYYPEVALIGKYERNGDSIKMDENDFSNESNLSITLQAKWTFFEWGKTKSAVCKASYEKKALQRTIQNTENAVCLEVNTALLTLIVAGKNIKTAKGSLLQAKENWRITKAQYTQQVSTSSEVLDARTFLTRADSNYYGALYGYMISLAELNRAIGKR
jgi:outer membrane protein